jgi:hypothetical protein
MATLQMPIVQVLLWFAAVAATVWILGPCLMYALGKNRFWVDVSDNGADAEPNGRDRKYEARFREFVALGFRPAGKTVEHGSFMSPLHWHYKSDGARFLAAPDGKTFVGSHRIAGGNPLRTTAYTIFEEGGLIMSASPGVALGAAAGGNYKYEPVGDVEPAELLDIHARRVEVFARERALTVKAATMREVGAEVEKHSLIVLPKMKLGLHFGMVITFMLPVAMTAFTNRGALPGGSLPAVICACAAMYALFRWASLPNRIPMPVRMGVLVGVMLLGPFGFISRALPDPERMVERALDRLDARATVRDTAGAVERIAGYGPRGCTPLLRRLENPATKPQTRAIIHDALVRLHGSDLGEAPAAWQDWCSAVREPKR